MLPQTEHHIRGLSDDALIEYVQAGTTLYERDAVTFARQVLTERNLSPQQLSDLEAMVEHRSAADVQRLQQSASVPLSQGGKCLAFLAGFLLGIGIPCLLVSWLIFRSRGEHQKVRDLWRYAVMGFVSLWTVLIALFIVPGLFR
jgi:hypothetical protein